MSCCISSAVCCALVTAAMAGIALGYNYSLAEYIDLKETNVSVYLKRGVFDDEIADDMDWRRSGHMPVQGHLRDNNLMTGAPENEEMPLRAGRRMDDSLVVSDDRHNFEGSLMRLTIKPPSYKSSIEPVTSDAKMAQVLGQYPSGSVEQMKAIHGLLNQRRANDQRNTKMTSTKGPEQPVDLNGRRLSGIAPQGVPMFDGPLSNDPYDIAKARLAVPDRNIGDPPNWFLPKSSIPETYRRTMDFPEYHNIPSEPYTFPPPIHYTVDMKRPTRPKAVMRPTHTIPASKGMPVKEDDILNEVPEAEIERFKSKLLKDDQDLTRLRDHQFRKVGEKDVFQSEEDYAEQANKGYPIRKKRAIIGRTHKSQIRLFNLLTNENKQANSTLHNANDKQSYIISKKVSIAESKKVNTTNQLNVTVSDSTTLKQVEIIFTHPSKNNINSAKFNITSTITIRNDSYIPHTLIRPSYYNLDKSGKSSRHVLIGKLAA